MLGLSLALPGLRRSAGGPGDPFFSDVVLLTKGMTDLTLRHTVSITDGAPAVTGDYVTVDGNDALTFNGNLDDFALPGLFTLDIKGVFRALGATSVIVGNYIGGNVGSWEFFVTAAGNYGFYSDSGLYVPSPGVIGYDTEVEISVCYDGSNTRLAHNGTIVATTAGTFSHVPSPLRPCFVGKENDTSGKFANGDFRFRLTKDVARWTANYTPEPWLEH